MKHKGQWRCYCISPHHKRSIVVWEAQRGVSRRGSCHFGRNRSDPPAALDTWRTRSMLDASRGSAQLWRQRLPSPLHWCLRHTVNQRQTTDDPWDLYFKHLLDTACQSGLQGVGDKTCPSSSLWPCLLYINNKPGDKYATLRMKCDDDYMFGTFDACDTLGMLHKQKRDYADNYSKYITYLRMFHLQQRLNKEGQTTGDHTVSARGIWSIQNTSMNPRVVSTIARKQQQLITQRVQFIFSRQRKRRLHPWQPLRMSPCAQLFALTWGQMQLKHFKTLRNLARLA